MRVLVLSDTHAPRRWRGAPARVAAHLHKTLRLDLDGLAIGMIHDSGPARGRLARMHRAFPDRQLVVFGHSHIPLDIADESLRLFNPGSPTDRRRQPHGTLGMLTIENGQLIDVRILPVT